MVMCFVYVSEYARMHQSVSPVEVSIMNDNHDENAKDEIDCSIVMKISIYHCFARRFELKDNETDKAKDG
jgi:hypothetical protein